MNEKYKKDHEAFVSSNLNGTSPLEVLACSVTEISIAIIRTFSFTPTFEQDSFYKLFYTVAESYLISIPSILVFTVLNQHLIFINLILLTIAVCGLMLKSRKETNTTRRVTSNRFEFISQFRSHLLLDTIINILAVDFQIYPRRFAKTETFGWSVMDVGAGMFVVAAGMVAPETRKNTKMKQWQNLYKTLTSSSYLIVLGLLRMLATRQVNYHEHVTEYGVHWNFFITLAVTRIFCSCILLFIPVRFSVHFAVALISLYQFFLSNLKLTEFILSEDRSDILKANKEGLLSLFGYVSSYLAAIHLGRIINKNVENKPRLFTYLLSSGIIFYVLMHVACWTIQPVSRRIHNLPYCLWVISLLCTKLATHLAIDAILKDRAQCDIISAINKNGLSFFIIGNVLTGIVNLSVNTLSSSPVEAILILTIYVLLSFSFVLLMSHFNIFLK